MGYKQNYQRWLAQQDMPQLLLQELKNIQNDESEIEDRFYKNLEFGTGGLRGILGAGINRMNIYTVRQASQGMADYILSCNAGGQGVAISYDCRNNSELFARETARVFAANGIKVYLSDALRPVPILSFAVRHFGAKAGAMVTASHNPPQYNGYKAYGEDGCQFPPEAADKVLEAVQQNDIFTDVKICDFNAAVKDGLIVLFGEELEELYLQQIYTQRINKNAVKDIENEFKMVYTPLHGSGNVPVRKALAEIGVKNLYLVDSQVEPDGNFPTVKSPNPEETEAFTLAIKLAKEHDVDYILGTDPDCDRIGIVVRDDRGEYMPLTGNMVGALLTDYILKNRKNTLPSNGVVIKTIVTTRMIDAICEKFNVPVLDVLTGFKFIGEKMTEFEQTGEHEYIFGFEESYGYLVGTHARDKDGVVSSMIATEMVAWYQKQGKSLYRALMDLYSEYGNYREVQWSVTLAGKDGIERMQSMMKQIRQNPPPEMAGRKILVMKDILTQTCTDLQTGEKTAIDLPESDVLLFEVQDETWFAVRPSGTEPKIKFYCGTRGQSVEQADAFLEQMKDAILKFGNEL